MTSDPVCVFSPAVSHYGPSVWWVEELDLSDEAQQSGGVTGNTVVRPAGKVKLAQFTDFMMTLLEKTQRYTLYQKINTKRVLLDVQPN